MRTESSAPGNGVVVAHGYGVKIHVDRGHLLIHDGVGPKRQTRRFARATCGIKRLFVIGHTGYITFEAARWLREIGAAYAQIDCTGNAVLVSGAVATDHAPLRRAQALAPYCETGATVARLLLTEKTDGQAALLPELPASDESRAAMGRACRELAAASSIGTLLAAEAAAAAAYWDAWSAVPVPFARREAARLPAHWFKFGQRSSPLSGSPRLAINPANAILNYLYALLEVEASIACAAIGLDPGLGFFHTDRKARDSLALDVMEACRPLVDAYLLTLLGHRTLSPGDFVETRRGDCRIRPQLAKQLAETAPAWRSYMAPVVERTAQVIADGAARPFAVPTPLTGTGRRVAWEGRKPRAVHRRAQLPPLPATCRGCGSGLPDRRRRYCDACRQASAERAAITGRPLANAALQRLRDQGRDPAHGGAAGKRRGRRNAEHQQAIAAWRANGPEAPDSGAFEREVAPRLRERRIAEIVEATGLSEHYCSLIRLGKRTPHPRHWEALERCVSAGADGPARLP